MKHYLRSFGQSRKCCPINYYNNDEKQIIVNCFINNKPANNKDIIKSPQRFQFHITNNNDLQKERDNPNNWVCGQAVFNSHHKFFRERNRRCSEHSVFYDLEVFEPYLYYHNCDYREKIEYSRVSNDLYLKDGIEASEIKDKIKAKIKNKQQNNNNNINNDFLHPKAKLAAKKKKEDEVHVNGVKRPWIFSLLNYMNIAANICFDPFHVLKNIVNYLFSMLFGRSKVRSSTVKFCKNTASHPTLVKKKEEAYKKKKNAQKSTNANVDDINVGQVEVWKGIWNLNNPMLKKLEIYLQNILIPSGSPSSLRLKASISSFGLVKGKELIEICECKMDFICWSIQQITKREGESYPNEYLYFYCMLSSYISDLLAPVINKLEINVLYYQAVEIISIYEGLYPVSETKMIHHQLIDLPHYIKQFGPLRGWWTFPSERSIAQIKREMGSNKGGRNYVKKVYEREYSKEFMLQKEMYKDKESVFRDKHFFVKKDDNIEMSFTGYKTEILWNDNPKSKSTIIDLSRYEIQEFLLFLINQMILIQPDENERFILSPLYRLYFSYKFYGKNYKLLKFNDGTKVQKFCKDDSDFVSFLESLINSNIPDELLIIDDDEELFIKNEGKMYLKNDLPLIAYYLYSITSNIHVSNKALIWGTKFNSRGYEFREKDKYSILPTGYGANTTYQKRQNDLNNMSDNFHMKRVYSSWFRSKNINSDEELHIGQNNCFFELHIEHEIILNKLPISMVTMREVDHIFMLKSNNKNYYYENLFKSTETIKLSSSNCIFQLLYNIYPMEITCAPMKQSINNTLSPVSKTSTDKPICYIHSQLNRNYRCILDNDNIFKKTNHPYNRSNQ